MEQKRIVYLDNASTTPVDSSIKDSVHDILDIFGNPSSATNEGVMAKELIETVREDIKNFIGADENYDLVFTSGGTEGNNLAIKGVAEGYKDIHLITSVIEHPSITNTFKYLNSKGFDVSYIPVNEGGVVDINQLKMQIKSNTKLISIMYVNNEIGSIQPIYDIGKIAKENNIIFHTDAVQAFGKIPIDVIRDNIDMITFSGHKIHAPKGIGGIVYNNRIKLSPLIHGGNQEHGVRSGTENVFGILSLGRSILKQKKMLVGNIKEVEDLKSELIKRISGTIPNIKINGSETGSIPHILNISFIGVEAETILVSLDLRGIRVSKGSACSSNQIKPSHVLLSIGLEPKIALSSIRFSFSHNNNLDDIDYLMHYLPAIVKNARAISLN